MNLSYFISKRINQGQEGSFSSSIGKIAVASITIGLASTLIAFLILRGFQTTIEEKIFGFAGHMQVTRYTLSSSYEQPPISLNSDFYTNWPSYDFIQHAQPFGYKPGLLKTDEEVLGVLFKGVDKAYDTARFAPNLKEGRFISFPDTTYSLEVLISRKIADKLLLHTGDQVVMYFVQNPPRFRRLQIAGIYETGLEDFDEQIIIGDLGLIQRLNNWDNSEVSGYEVFLKNPSRIEQAEEEMFEVLDPDLYAETSQDRYLQIFDWLNLLNRNVVIFLVLILFVACFNMVSILLILIMERTTMIGVLKALGATDKVVRTVFSWNGMLLIVKGMILGNLVALGFGFLQSYFKLIPLDAANYYMDHVPIYWDWPAMIFVNVLTFVVVNLTLLIPTMIISRITPISSIKFD